MINRETAIALAKEAGMAGMLTDVVCSLEEIHRLCNLAVAHSRKDAEPVTLGEFRKWVWKELPANTIIGNPDWWAERIYKRFISDTHPPEADKLLQQALEYAKLMKLYGPALGYGNTTIDDHIAAIRTYLEGK